MGKFRNTVGTKCFSPKGTKYDSPGQGRTSVARQAAALDSECRQVFGRARSFAIIRRIAEAETKPRFDFVFGHTASSNNANCSDDAIENFPTQGSRPGLSYFPPSGKFCANV